MPTCVDGVASPRGSTLILVGTGRAIAAKPNFTGGLTPHGLSAAVLAWQGIGFCIIATKHMLPGLLALGQRTTRGSVTNWAFTN